MSHRLLMLRHGQIQANVDGKWHGSTDSPLINLGTEQARLTGQHLKEHEQISSVFSSPLQRCEETARLACKDQKLEITLVPGFAEMSIGEWEGTPFTELNQRFDFIYKSTSDLDYAAPGGESLNQVFSRFSDSIEHIKASEKPGGTSLIVSHGAAISIVLAGLIEKDLSKWHKYHFDNCSLTEIFFENAPRLGMVNSSAHLSSLG